jgi:hypothetical protein
MISSSRVNINGFSRAHNKILLAFVTLVIWTEEWTKGSCCLANCRAGMAAESRGDGGAPETGRHGCQTVRYVRCFFALIRLATWDDSI